MNDLQRLDLKNRLEESKTTMYIGHKRKNWKFKEKCFSSTCNKADCLRYRLMIIREDGQEDFPFCGWTNLFSNI